MRPINVIDLGAKHILESSIPDHVDSFGKGKKKAESNENVEVRQLVSTATCPYRNYGGV
jgi:hypothetical protein